MARALSRTVDLARRLGAQAQLQLSVALGRRHSHTRQRAAEVIEAEAAGPSTAADSAMKQRLEEVIDGAIARMAEPAWAPFRPGTSYFAPPRPAGAARWLLALLSRSGEMDLRPLRRGLSVDEAAPWPPPPAVTRVRPTSSTATFLMRWRAQGWMMPIKLKRNEWKGYLWCGI